MTPLNGCELSGESKNEKYYFVNYDKGQKKREHLLPFSKM